jgi:hypothetical protein
MPRQSGTLKYSETLLPLCGIRMTGLGSCGVPGCFNDLESRADGPPAFAWLRRGRQGRGYPLFEIINFHQAQADAAVLPGEDRGELSGRQ